MEEKYLRCWGAVMKYLRVLEKMGDKYTVSFSHSFIDFPIFRGRVHVSRLVCGVVFIGAEDVGSAWCASRASGSITAAAVKVMAAGSHSHSSDVFKRSLPGCHSWCHCSLLVALMFAIDVFGVIDYCLRGGRSSTVYSSKVGNSHLPCGGPTACTGQIKKDGVVMGVMELMMVRRFCCDHAGLGFQSCLWQLIT